MLTGTHLRPHLLPGPPVPPAKPRGPQRPPQAAPPEESGAVFPEDGDVAEGQAVSGTGLRAGGRRPVLHVGGSPGMGLRTGLHPVGKWTPFIPGSAGAPPGNPGDEARPGSGARCASRRDGGDAAGAGDPDPPFKKPWLGREIKSFVVSKSSFPRQCRLCVSRRHSSGSQSSVLCVSGRRGRTQSRVRRARGLVGAALSWASPAALRQGTRCPVLAPGADGYRVLADRPGSGRGSGVATARVLSRRACFCTEVQRGVPSEGCGAGGSGSR